MSGIGGNMDYSTLSDFEINKRVAQYIDITPDNIFDNEEVIFKPVGNDEFEKFDPCNNVSHTWPIILANKININWRESIKSGVMAEQSGWSELYSINKNPLRAAMEVYLMVKDVENEN
ncbi:putative protein ninX [Xenorhabdus bovienii str. Intermedium]|uniref:DUF2591 domain-containing protein n=3 Tax=Xenorhabdus bovienii TaxID=40576 RepID=A0A077QC65_XENBV|nr:putative protein ninX [Xenorhabdus bovienii str. Intermedium]